MNQLIDHQIGSRELRAMIFMEQVSVSNLNHYLEKNIYKKFD
jgi:hypothetical protein